MGLADRDYMRDRQKGARSNVRRFGPPEASARSTVWLIILLVGLAYGSFKTWAWWQDRVAPPAVQSNVALPAQASTPTNHPSLTGDWDPDRRLEPTPPSPRNAATTNVIIKCVIDGQTMYVQSASDCAAGAAKSRVAIDPEQNLSQAIPVAPRPLPVHIAQAPAAPDAEAANPHVSRKAICLAYEEEIKHLDARARQPLPASAQDRLRARRKVVRDEQFRLRC